MDTSIRHDLASIRATGPSDSPRAHSGRRNSLKLMADADTLFPDNLAGVLEFLQAQWFVGRSARPLVLKAELRDRMCAGIDDVDLH